MTTETVTLELSRAEALVLFEFVSRHSDSRRLEILDQAEQRVLWDICCTLEKTLVEPFMPNYKEVLEMARAQVRDKS